MLLECELDPEDAGGISGITAPLKLSPKQQTELEGMILDGRIHPGEDVLNIEGQEITEDNRVMLDPVESIGSKVARSPSARARKQRRLVSTLGELKMLLVRVTDSNGLVHSDNAVTMR